MFYLLGCITTLLIIAEFESTQEFDTVATYLEGIGFNGETWLGTVNTGPTTGYKWIQNDCFLNGEMTSDGNLLPVADLNRNVEFKITRTSVSSNSGALSTDPNYELLAVLCEVFH